MSLQEIEDKCPKIELAIDKLTLIVELYKKEQDETKGNLNHLEEIVEKMAISLEGFKERTQTQIEEINKFRKEFMTAVFILIVANAVIAALQLWRGG